MFPVAARRGSLSLVAPPGPAPPAADRSADERFLRRALALARRGLGAVEPNPLVGCVLVRGGRIIGEGWHRRFGGPHAEVDALRRATAPPRGATAYVTLEPCCHHGKTPPCTDALLAAGIARVVAPLRDPNPAVAGRGFAQLRRAGVRVDVGLLADEAAALNAAFFKRMRTGRPWVVLKWAQSLDGRIATRTGDAQWISNEACRAHAHRVRARLDALLVGVNTVIVDDPLLTARVKRLRRVATRIVLDTRLRTPLRARLVRTARVVPTWIFCAPDAPAARARRLSRAGCQVHSVCADAAGLHLPSVLDALGAAGMANVLVEGGGRLLGSFLDARLADEVQIYIAPLLIGGHGAPAALDARGPARLADALRLPPGARLRRLGDGWFLQARLAP